MLEKILEKGKHGKRHLDDISLETVNSLIAYDPGTMLSTTAKNVDISAWANPITSAIPVALFAA